MKNHKRFFVIGILALVLLFVNLAIMYPISQTQLGLYIDSLYDFGWNGSGDVFKPDTLYPNGLQFSYEWKTLYDAYNMSLTEIILVSLICVSVAIISFSIAVYKMHKKGK